MRFPGLIVAGVVLAACQGVAEPAVVAATEDTCTATEADAALLETAEGADHEAALMRIEACVASPDPAMRDDFAYTSLAAAMREGQVSADEARAMMGRLMAVLDAPEADPEGYHRPFAALALSEIARMDRIAAYLTDDERIALALAGARYLNGLEDYRGFTDGEGWRHGVAHTADLFLQLALNPELPPAAVPVMLDAIAGKVAPEGHAYVFGEPERLARPVLYLSINDAAAGTDWAAWFAALGPAGDAAAWETTYASEAGLARLHNVRAFGEAVYIPVSKSEQPALIALGEAATGLLAALP